jgi:hypothetical protein
MTVTVGSVLTSASSQPNWYFGGGGVVMAGLFFVFLPRRRRLSSVLCCLLSVAVILGASGCGGHTDSSVKSSTQPGTYTVLVTGTSSTVVVQ